MLGYLLSPTVQFEDTDGKPLVGGKVYVYKANTTTLATTYSDYNGTMNTNPIILDLLGHCTVIADDDEYYDIEVHNKDNDFLFSSHLVAVGGEGGSASVSGFDVKAGYGIKVGKSISGNKEVFTVSADPTYLATKTDLNSKQNVLYPGDNISISGDTISVTGLKTINVTSPLQKTETPSGINLSIDTSIIQRPISAGTDIKIETINGVDVVGIDTTSIIFAGRNNFVAGSDGIVSGDCNILAGSANNVSGDYNTVFGKANEVSGNNNTVFGSANSANGNSDFLIGNGLTSNGNHAKIGNANCFIDVDYINKKMYKSIDGVLSEIGDTYSAGSNINITNNVISGKDWSNDINSATSGKLDKSTYNSFVSTADVTPYSAGNGIKITNHIISVNPYKSGISINPGEGGSLYNNSTQTNTSDKFMIYISRAEGAAHSKISVYNFNTSRDLYAFVNGTQAATIYSSSNSDVATFTSIENLITLEIIGMGVGDELPYYKFTIVADDNPTYGTEATLYELYRYTL